MVAEAPCEIYEIKASTIDSMLSDGGANSNQCASEPGYECCPNGLREAAGWDPLSGLGSIDLAELLKHAVRGAAP